LRFFISPWLAATAQRPTFFRVRWTCPAPGAWCPCMFPNRFVAHRPAQHCCTRAHDQSALTSLICTAFFPVRCSLALLARIVVCCAHRTSVCPNQTVASFAGSATAQIEPRLQRPRRGCDIYFFRCTLLCFPLFFPLGFSARPPPGAVVLPAVTPSVLLPAAWCFCPPAACCCALLRRGPLCVAVLALRDLAQCDCNTQGAAAEKGACSNTQRVGKSTMQLEARRRGWQRATLQHQAGGEQRNRGQ